MTLSPINQIIPLNGSPSGFPWPPSVDSIERQIAETRAAIASGDARDEMASRLHGLKICKRIALGIEPPMTTRIVLRADGSAWRVAA